jgi:PAS domain S-box-containing protein
VTDRPGAGEDADRIRDLLQQVVDNAPLVISFKDREGRCLLINRRGAAMLGRDDPAEVIGLTDFEMVPADLAERNQREDRQVMESGTPMTFAKDVPLADGTVRPFVTTKFPVHGADGTPNGVGVFSSDISVLREAEADRALLDALVEAAPDAIISKDREEHIVTWNPGAERMFGRRAEEVLGRSYEVVVVAEDDRELYRRLREQVVAGARITVRMGGLRADGTVFPTEVSAGPLTSGDGSVTGIVAIVRDITDLGETELQLRDRASRLERSNADLETFAFAASHDLQEPLRSIQLGAETVLRSAADCLEADERAVLAQVSADAARMSGQVRALMELARAAHGDQPEGAAPVELALEDALTSLRAAIRDAGAQVDVVRPLPVAAAPRAELAIILQNLIANALKFNRPGVPAHVTVSGRVDDGCAEVRVADEGVGLSEADLRRIFGIFGRARPDVPGSGIGLALVRRLLERRGGSIIVESAGPNQGAEFVVRLPAATAG